METFVVGRNTVSMVNRERQTIFLIPFEWCHFLYPGCLSTLKIHVQLAKGAVCHKTNEIYDVKIQNYIDYTANSRTSDIVSLNSHPNLSL